MVWLMITVHNMGNQIKEKSASFIKSLIIWYKMCHCISIKEKHLDEARFVDL
jgi:hypothetical protein